jgi:hypothetical protein
LAFCLKSPDQGWATLDQRTQQVRDGGLGIVCMFMLSHPNKRVLHEVAVQFLQRRVELASAAVAAKQSEDDEQFADPSFIAAASPASSASSASSFADPDSDQQTPPCRFLVPKDIARLFFAALALTLQTHQRSTEIQMSVMRMLTDLTTLRTNVTLLFSIQSENSPAVSATSSVVSSAASTSAQCHSTSSSTATSSSELSIGAKCIDSVMSCVQRFSFKNSINETVQHLGCQFFLNVALNTVGKRECQRLGVVSFLDRNVTRNSRAYETSQIVYRRIAGSAVGLDFRT